MNRKFPFIIGKIYHIFNQGAAKCPICLEENDSWRFLQGLCLFNDKKSTNRILWQIERDRGKLTLGVLRDYIVNPENERERWVRILAYCIMDDHYHLLMEEIMEGGISKFMHKLGTGYVNFFNKKHNRVGRLFRNTFKNIPVDNERYLQYLLVYINVLNPCQFIEPDWKQKGIYNIKKVLQFAAKYQWSSHLDYLGKRKSIIVEKGILGELLPMPEDYLHLVKMVLREKKYKEIESLFCE